MYRMLTLLGLAAVITTAAFGASAQAGGEALKPPQISIKLLPASAGAQVRTVNVYLTNPNRTPSGLFIFDILPSGGGAIAISVKLVGFKATIQKSMTPGKPSFPDYHIRGSSLAPGQRIYYQVVYRSADFNSGACLAPASYFLRPTPLSDNTPESCWNLGKK